MFTKGLKGVKSFKPSRKQGWEKIRVLRAKNGLLSNSKRFLNFRAIDGVANPKGGRRSLVGVNPLRCYPFFGETELSCFSVSRPAR